MTFALLTAACDIHALAQLINRAYRGHEGNGRWTTEQHLVEGDRIQPEQLRALFNRDDVEMLAALDSDGQPIACIAIHYLAEVAEFGTFAVDPQRHGSGIGKQLLAAAEQHASHRRSRFQVEVVNENSALRRFYQRRGYQLTGEIMPYPLQAGVGQPKIEGLHLQVLQKQADTEQPC
jgi:ribosomal protein S18 acetylase RimI-like enzyme